MIHTMTDETYAVNCSLELPQKEKEDTMFWVAVLSWIYWIISSVIGGVLGQLIPFQLEGIDFCMTALFVIIFMEQWEKTENQPLYSSCITHYFGDTCFDEAKEGARMNTKMILLMIAVPTVCTFF